nr:MAG TPA: hypothetical protein [Caudoviricetes sp.]
MATQCEYKIYRITYYMPDGTKETIKKRMTTTFLEELRKELKEARGAVSVDFAYEEIPLTENKLTIKL